LWDDFGIANQQMRLPANCPFCDFHDFSGANHRDLDIQKRPASHDGVFEKIFQRIQENPDLRRALTDKQGFFQNRLLAVKDQRARNFLVIAIVDDVAGFPLAPMNVRVDRGANPEA